MSTVVERAKPEQPWEADPWRYGWRYVNEQLPDGTVRRKQVPLTEEDVLHPQEDDFIMQNPAHVRDCVVVKQAIETRMKGRPEVIVLFDCRIDWGVAGVEPHGPDVAVLEGVGEWEPARGTFYLAEHQARPLLVVEITSPSTREGDLNAKVVEYHRAGIPFYAIVDATFTGDRRQIRLLGYRFTPNGYLRMPLDAQGRLWLEAVGMWLKVDGTQVACIDEEGNRLGVHLEVVQERDEAKQQAADEKARAETEKARAEAEKERAEAEKERAEAEKERAEAAQAEIEALRARLLQVEAELQQRQNPPS